MTRLLFLTHVEKGRADTGGRRFDRMVLGLLESMPGVELTRHALMHTLTRGGKMAAPWRALRLLNQASRYDIIILPSSGCLYLLPFVERLQKRKRAGIPTVIAIHHHFLCLQFKRLKRKAVAQAEYRLLRMADRVATPSPYMHQLLGGLSLRHEPLLWPIPFEHREVRPEPVAGNLLYIGTVEPRKGLHLLLDALGELQRRGLEFSMTIAGEVVDGEYMARLYCRANDLDIKNLHFTGFVTSQEKRRLMSHADVFMFPSLLEGYGIVLGEALSYGLPVVCFDNSAMPSTIHHGSNGFLAPSGDSATMAEYTARLLTDRRLRERLSAQAREDAQRLPDRAALIEALQSIINQ